ncbi:hypothetical protein AVL55_03835 [Alteromonas macleodii]|uniref:Uncharacterized protein n=1 Tax=Alteromonas macleodii TaxID=28108 RepID=A0A126PYQ6_ALTMA|nr:hypothetical protein [Alteromonas macleodii]AMJ97368.1 hypothetical protein AVL55_03835 [Alteromonas macleodii]
MQIYLYFSGDDAISLAAIEEVTKQLRKMLIEIERKDLKIIRKKFPEIPFAVLKKVSGDMDEYLDDPTLFKVAAVKKGSLGLYLSLTALCYWLLDKTLGETVKDAWIQTSLHRRLKAYFIKNKTEKLKQLQREINSSIEKPKARQVRSNITITVPMRADLDEDANILSIRIEYSSLKDDLDKMPTYEDLGID